MNTEHISCSRYIAAKIIYDIYPKGTNTNTEVCLSNIARKAGEYDRKHGGILSESDERLIDKDLKDITMLALHVLRFNGDAKKCLNTNDVNTCYKWILYPTENSKSDNV